ncbi:MAG TPA: flagellar basal body rod protein FlgC [Clostridiales bacterium]|nr:flagellar basal body rod protein FlgC [Clostridiales bacterium]
MAFLDSLNIAGSGLTATRLRMDVISENIANASTTRTESGGPYRRQMVVYQSVKNQSFQQLLNSNVINAKSTSKGGVKVQEIVEDQSDFTPVYNPSHPDADENGYVMMPNVNPIQEMIDMMAATRAYDLNLSAVNAIKSMASKALEIGR